MKVTSLMYGMRSDFDERKRALQRKEAGEVYKKHAQYADPNKNPVLQALENLLSGKTEKDLLAVDNAVKESITLSKDEQLEQPEVKKELEQFRQTEKEVIAHEMAHKAVGSGVTGPITYSHTIGPDNQRYIVAGEVSIDARSGATPEETVAILEKVRQAALAPAEPSPQDLRVAASAVAQIQQAKGEQISEQDEEVEQEPFANEVLYVEIPQQFQGDFVRDPARETVFGKELEIMLFQRTFKKATANYSSHIAMVKNGYRMPDEPTFSKTA